jgi:hypothetical protein
MKRIVHSILFNRGLIFALLALLFLAGNVVSVQAQEEPILVDSWGFHWWQNRGLADIGRRTG